MQEKLYIALLHSLGITQKKLHLIFGENLLGENKSAQNFYTSMNSGILEGYGIRKKEIESILKRRETVTVDAIEKVISERNVEIIVFGDENYPEDLTNIGQVPYILYVRGRIGTGPKIAVVGSRKITSYGTKVIEHIVPDVSKYFTIVSGGAYGCDTTAHKVALGSGNKTIAVIGTAINEDYPTGNAKLYDEIVESGGAVISIFAIGVPGNAYNFPIRNEIVAGLSVGILVVEAQEKSGSLITAKLALDVGKDLFAIPGEIFKSNSRGCNMLIKNGEAKSVIDSLDILEEYNVSKINKADSLEKKLVVFSDEIEEKIYGLLLLEGFTIDELVNKLGINISVLSLKLSMLELQGHIKKTLGGKFEVK